MRIDEQFPSKYLKAADLQSRVVPVTISHVDIEDISGGEMKPILYFQGKEKGLVLNKTNSNNIAFAYGYETEEWVGKQIELFEAMVDFQGRSVPAIRVRPPQRRAAPKPVPQRAASPAPANGQQYDERNPPPISDEDIPF